MTRRITNFPTVVRITGAMRPVVSRLNTLLAARYLRLCRNHGQQRRVIAICTGVAAMVFFVNIVQLQSQKQQLAANFTVLVATSDIASGQRVTTAEVRPLLVPASLVSASVIVDLPGTAYAQQNIGVGEVITSINVTDQAVNISVVPAGWRTIAITSPTALPPMSAGDHVDVIANGVVLVTNAVVVAAAGELSPPNNMTYTTHVVIGVPADAAPSVATAAALGDATLVVAS